MREIIRGKGLTQTEAAKILGLTQPKLSGILRGQFRGVSERKLIDCLKHAPCKSCCRIRVRPGHVRDVRLDIFDRLR